MIKVELTDSEIMMARILGNMRTLVSRHPNTTYTSLEYNIQKDEEGVIGEMAFCKHWNIFFNPESSYRHGTSDAVLKGKNIDVKSTRKINKGLQVPHRVNKDIDVFVLGIIEGNTVTFVGYATAADVYRPENLQQLSHSPAYVLPQERLTKWK